MQKHVDAWFNVFTALSSAGAVYPVTRNLFFFLPVLLPERPIKLKDPVVSGIVFFLGEFLPDLLNVRSFRV